MRLSVQLYTVREPMSTDPWNTLTQLRDMGLTQVELAGTYGLSAADFRAKLDELGLAVTASHAGLGDLEERFDEVVADHKTMGCDTIFIPWISSDDWDNTLPDFQKRMSAMGERMAAAGMTFGFHNHGHELLNGKLGEFFDGCPDSVKVQLDLGWVYVAGEDPVKWLKRFGSRVVCVHLKDMDMAPDSPDAIAGHGKLEWDGILAACTEIGVPVGTIEMDNPPGNAIESVRECVSFFRSKGVSV